MKRALWWLAGGMLLGILIAASPSEPCECVAPPSPKMAEVRERLLEAIETTLGEVERAQR